jgi:hypothetical protein
MSRILLLAARAALPVVFLSACTANVDGRTEAALVETERAFAIESHVDGIFPLGEVCVLHLIEGTEWTGLVVSASDEAPRCGELQPYLSGDSRLLEWNAADVVEITDTEALQNLSEAYDRDSGREVTYLRLNGPLREWLWGATYGDGESKTIAGIGDVCVLYVETDIGGTLGFVEARDASGECPRTGPFMSSFHSLQILAQETAAIADPSVRAALDASTPRSGVEWVSPNGAFLVLMPGGIFDRRAADSIVANRPLASIAALGALYWVGPSALTRLRDFECPAGSELEAWECVDSDGLLPFGAGCLGGGDAACESGLCTTSWDGYFCYYTSCTASCLSAEDCEDAALAAGFDPRDVIGTMWCVDGVCDIQHLRTGDRTCE